MHPIVHRLRQPAYTGTRRCWPCTVVNLVVLATFTAVVAVLSVPGAIGFGIIGSFGIWLRGYLIPYTPQFAPRLVDMLPWDPFHTTQRSDSLATPEDTGGEAVIQALDEGGVVRVGPETLELNDSFHADWQAEMERISSLCDEDIADETATASQATVDADVHHSGERTYVILSDGSGSPAGESWLRRPVAVVETAAAYTLAEWDVDSAMRPAAAHALGLFLDTCPMCGGEVTERPSSGCCGPPERGPDGELLQARVCESCSVRYHTY